MTLWLEELYEQQTKVLMMYDKPNYSRINDAYLKVLTEGGHNQKANVVNQLTQLKRNAEHLLEQVNADLEYPAWWVNKLVKANDYLDTAHDYLNNKVDQGQSPIQKDESVNEDAADAAKLKAKQAAEAEKLKDKQEADKESLKSKHERETETQKRKDEAEKASDQAVAAREGFSSFIKEANKQIQVGWDMGDPKRIAPDWQDEFGIVMVKWDKRKAAITVSGDEKELLKWLTTDYGMDKKDSQDLIRKGKRVR